MTQPVYLDHAATTPVRDEVMAAMAPFFGARFGNPSSVHRWGREARVALELDTLVLAALAYLTLLVLIAEATERGWIPRRVADHPWVHALSLGVYATSWSYFGSVGFAEREGLAYLGIYLGATLAGLAVPFVWRPLLALVEARQLGSLADVLAYRYQSPRVGALTTVLLVGGSLPYLALQIRAIVGAVHAVSGATSVWLAPGYALFVALFAAVFGAR